MAKVEGGDDLSEEPPRLLRGQPALLDEVVEQLTPRHVLQHQVLIQFSTVQYSSVHKTTYQVFSVLVNIVQAEHVLVLDQLHDCNLALNLIQFKKLIMSIKIQYTNTGIRIV